jgi:PPOX class probable F420-dependent enzyme
LNQRDTADILSRLEGHKYILLTTHRKNGDAIPTPVWFAAEDGKLYISTSADAGKVKRVRNDPHVELAPCNARGVPLGPGSRGLARVVSSASEERRARGLLLRKYRTLRLFELAGALRGQRRAYLELSPE